MTQKTLKDFFSKNQDSDSSESSEFEEFLSGENKNVSYYQKLLKDKTLTKECTKIIPTYGAGAECWKYFGNLYVSNKQILTDYKFCVLCFEENVVLKCFRATTSTTNYTNHLKTVHNTNVKSIHFKKTEERTAKCLTTASKSKNTKFGHARNIAEMCCIDLQPFNIVERTGFRNYVQKFLPDTQLPTATTVATAALDDVYNVYLSAVRNILEKSPNEMTLVLDMWSDKFKKLSYINIKVHFCEDFVLSNFSLKTEHFPHPHTAKAVADKVLECLKFFGLEKKNLNAVSDAGSNIVASMKLRNIQRFNCLAHTTHRFLTHDLLSHPQFQQLSNEVLKLKRIFRALNYRGEELQQLQKLKHGESVNSLLCHINEINCSVEMDDNIIIGDLEDELQAAIRAPHCQTLKNSVETRWNSILRMIDSFCQNVDVINMVLLKINKEELLIRENEELILNGFKEFLDIFAEGTTYLQGQKYPTISMSIYFYENIYSKLVQKGKAAEFDINIRLYEFAIEHFWKRYKILKIHLIAALMDPCQKNWTVLNKYVERIPELVDVGDNFHLDVKAAHPISKQRLIYQEIKKYQPVELPSTRGEPSPNNQNISGTRRKMLEFLCESGQNSSPDTLSLEIQNYFDIIVTDAESLDWWKGHQKIFPRVAKLANVCFGIPATSASSEIAFSMAGSCISEKRSRLHPSTVKKQLFIHDNFNAVKDFLT